MNGKRSTILYLHQRAPDAALEALNRLTGLRFTQWPESLVDRADALTGTTSAGAVPQSEKPKVVSG